MVGIVIGTAFTAIVQSLVKAIFNPFFGIVTANLDFSNYFVALAGKYTKHLRRRAMLGCLSSLQEASSPQSSILSSLLG